MAAMWMAQLSCRFPRRERRCTMWLPEDASIGGGAVIGGELITAGEPVNVGDIAQHGGGDDRTDAGEVGEGGLEAATMRVIRLLVERSCSSMLCSSSSNS